MKKQGKFQRKTNDNYLRKSDKESISEEKSSIYFSQEEQTGLESKQLEWDLESVETMMRLNEQMPKEGDNNSINEFEIDQTAQLDLPDEYIQSSGLISIKQSYFGVGWSEEEEEEEEEQDEEDSNTNITSLQVTINDVTNIQPIEEQQQSFVQHVHNINSQLIIQNVEASTKATVFEETEKPEDISEQKNNKIDESMNKILKTFLINFDRNVRKQIREERVQVMTMMKVILESFNLLVYIQKHYPEKIKVIHFLTTTYHKGPAEYTIYDEQSTGPFWDCLLDRPINVVVQVSQDKIQQIYLQMLNEYILQIYNDKQSTMTLIKTFYQQKRIQYSQQQVFYQQEEKTALSSFQQVSQVYVQSFTHTPQSHNRRLAVMYPTNEYTTQWVIKVDQQPKHTLLFHNQRFITNLFRIESLFMTQSRPTNDSTIQINNSSIDISLATSFNHSFNQSVQHSHSIQTHNLDQEIDQMGPFQSIVLLAIYWGQQRGIVEDKDKQYLQVNTLVQMVWFFLINMQKTGVKMQVSPYLSGFEFTHLDKRIRQAANVYPESLEFYYQEANDDIDILIHTHVKDNLKKHIQDQQSTKKTVETTKKSGLIQKEYGIEYQKKEESCDESKDKVFLYMMKMDQQKNKQNKSKLQHIQKKIQEHQQSLKSSDYSYSEKSKMKYEISSFIKLRDQFLKKMEDEKMFTIDMHYQETLSTMAQNMSTGISIKDSPAQLLRKFFFFYGYVVPNMNMNMSLFQGRFLPNNSPSRPVGYCILDPICEQYDILISKQIFYQDTPLFHDIQDEFSRAYRLITQMDFPLLCRKYAPENIQPHQS